MALLGSCWFIIESIVIPNGFLKWFYLSFYIHPIFLFVCQIFLWLKLLQKWVLVVIFYPLKIICLVGSCVFNFFKVCVIYIFSFNRLTHIEAIEEVESFEVIRNSNKSQTVTTHGYSSVAPIPCQLKVKELEKDKSEEEKDFDEDDAISYEDENMEEQSSDLSEDTSKNDCLSSLSSLGPSATEDANLNGHEPSISSPNSSPAKDLEMTECLPSVDSSNSLAVEGEVTNGSKEEVVDEFYKKYNERMSWFDVLNHDRTCGISAILNKQVGSSSSFESMKPVDLTISYISWNKMDRKRLLRSLESDFELVYVAQSCLTWEALHHQYRKVESLARSSSQNGVFYDNVACDFQKFQVLLERFMEDERCEGRRVWNYVKGRFSFKSLLQVPKVSDFFEQEKEEMKGEAVNVKEVMKAIEKCIEAFWIFVKTDNKKPWWKLRSSLWTCPPVEDPRDLALLADLTRKLQQKELWLKDAQGKQRCWFRRVVNPLEESQKKEALFTMIDMKLISRVLQMSMLSSPHLKWCQEKLDNIEFKEGKIVRACTSRPLFPP